MPRNGAGAYNLPAGNPVAPNTPIQSTWANSTLQDLGAAITGSLAKDGQTTPSANLPMGSFRHTGVGNATARSHYAAAGQVQDFAFSWAGTAGGTADALTLSPTPGISAYANGQIFWFVPASANTGAATVSISSLAKKAITKAGASALIAGDLAVGRIYQIVYDGAQFQLITDPLGTYAPLDSPAFTGTPTAPTASVGDNSEQLATTAFVAAATIPTGGLMMFGTTGAVSGWVYLNSTSIGSAASGATGRANADTAALYEFLWTNYTNAILTIQDSLGANTTRGVSAAADYAANKRMPLFDFRGYFARGFDDGRGIDTGRVIGSAQADDNKAHTHAYNTVLNTTVAGGVAFDAIDNGSNGSTTASSGGTEARPKNIALGGYYMKL